MHKSAPNWNRWPKRDNVCQLDKFCSVVGLFFVESNFFVLHLYVMQDCSSHIDQLSRLMENFL